MDLPAVTSSLDDQVTALRKAAGLRALDALGALAVRGRDRATWLNGMITNDVRALPPGRSVYAAIVSVKGRILSDVYVDAREDELLLVMPRDKLAEALEHFDRYIVMEDVFVSARELTVVSLQGPRAADLAPALGPTFAADRLGCGGVDLLVTPEDEASVSASLRALVERGDVVTVSSEAWEAARIESGVASFGVDYDGSNFVQEAGITGRAVSFHKGCYLGQEVVCRLEMRGQVQKRLSSLVIEGAPPPVGAAVTSEGKDVGRVTSAARSVSLPGRAVAIAMLKHAVIESSAPVSVNGAPALVTSRPAP